MAGAKRRGTSRQEEDPIEHPENRDEDGGVIDETGRSGVVETEHGVTSVGTTPIRVGSVEPVGHHREAAARIMGRDPGDDADSEGEDERPH